MFGLLLAVALGVAPGTPLTLAAPEFQGAKVAPEIVRFASEHVAQRLSDAGLKVVTARQMATLLGMERQKELLGCSEEAAACTLELGNALGAEGVLLGDLAQLGKGFVLNVKVTRTRDGAQLAATSVSADGEEGLAAALDRAADALRDQLGDRLDPQLPVARRSSRGLRRVAWIPAVAGGAALAAGAVLVGFAANTHAQLRDTTPRLPVIDAATTARAGELQQTGAWVAFGVGGAALATAGAFFLFGGSPEAQPAVTLVPGGVVVGVTGVLP